MDLRQFVRGTVDWADLEKVGHTLAERSDRPYVRIEFLEADNWLSTPLVVDGEWFVKVLTPQNVRVHGLLTGARNVGMFTSGTEGFFTRFDDPLAMAEHELEATRRIREIGVDAPEPLDAFAVGDMAVVVLEYLPEYRTLRELSATALADVAVATCESLARMHDNGLAHGDLREENVLVVDGEPVFIDATSVDADGLADARAYDLACLLAVLAPRIGAGPAVEIAADCYGVDAVLDAGRYLDFVNLRPDHEFDAALLKGEIEKAADG